jgi:hypothetical protein
VERARVMGPRVEATPFRPAVAQQAAMQAPRFAERRAQFVQSAPQVQRMPAPQIRVSERPIGAGHSGAAQASGSRGAGGWKHRG